MKADDIIVTLFFLLPGFLGVWVFEQFSVRRKPDTFVLTAWCLFLSVLGILPLLLFSWSRRLLDYLWRPGQLSETAVIGFLVQSASTMAIAASAGWLLRGPLKGRFAGRSMHENAWDWLWASPTRRERRYVEVRTETRRYLGSLRFASGGDSGRDIVLQDPAMWSEKKKGWYWTGMKLLYVPGSEIKSI